MDPNKNGVPLNKTEFVRASTLPRTQVWWSDHPTLLREEANLSQKSLIGDDQKADPQHSVKEEAGHDDSGGSKR